MADPIHVILDQPAVNAWSWVKDYGAPLAALLVAIVSNVVLWLKIRADSRAAVQKELTVLSIKTLEEQLSSFYDPILALLHLNKAVFESFGPPTFPEEIEARTDAARVWNLAADDVIVPNNSKICELLLTKSHLLSLETSAAGTAFLTHAHSYKIFREKGNIVHRSFPFPENFEVLIEHERNKLMNDLSAAKQKFVIP